MEIKIETGIPIPVRSTRIATSLSLNIDKLNVGDSFAIPLDPDEKENRKRRNLMYMRSRRIQIKIVVRILRKEGIMRVWRIK